MTQVTDSLAPETISAFNIPPDKPAVSRWCTPMVNKTTGTEVWEVMR